MTPVLPLFPCKNTPQCDLLHFSSTSGCVWGSHSPYSEVPLRSERPPTARFPWLYIWHRSCPEAERGGQANRSPAPKPHESTAPLNFGEFSSLFFCTVQDGIHPAP